MRSDSKYPPLPPAIAVPSLTSGELSEALEDQPLEARPSVLTLRRALRAGCYLIRFTPQEDVPSRDFHYDGTLRVQRDGGHTIASGDLYSHAASWMPGTRRPVEPSPSLGVVPIFPRGRYACYLRVTKLLAWRPAADGFAIGFEMHRFHSGDGSWTNEGAFTAEMSWTAAPASYPTSSDYLTGSVKDHSGTVVGKLTMGWVCRSLRRAVIEIDRVAASESPLNNGAAVDWVAIFNQVGWKLTVVESNADVTEPSGESWNLGECHAAMLDWRDSANLDTQWRYHLLCVRRLDETERGYMYDNGGTDSNNVPREGAAISSHWVFPNADPWGLCKGQRFGACAAPYFRTAVHEIGHAILLYHTGDDADNHIMQVTPQIAGNAEAPVQFPDNIEWSFSPEDQKRLRHMPDAAVRPGGVPFGTSYASVPISTDDMTADAEGLELRVTPVLEAIPIGAPVRVSVALVNTAGQPLPVPASLSMKSGQVSGKVIDPAGTARSFSTILLQADEVPLRRLEPGRRLDHALTLLRGAEGALFPSPGVHRILVNVVWTVDGVPVRAAGEAVVVVTAPVDEQHAKAALKVLSTPDALLTLVLGGDHLTDGVAAIAAGLAHPVLRPHFAQVEARRLSRRFRKRRADLAAAAELLDDKTVMSAAEVRAVAELVRDAPKDAPAEAVRGLARRLQAKAAELGADDATVKLLKSL